MFFRSTDNPIDHSYIEGSSCIEAYKKTLQNMTYDRLKNELTIIERIAHDIGYRERHLKIAAIEEEMAIRTQDIKGTDILRGYVYRTTDQILYPSMQ